MTPQYSRVGMFLWYWKATTKYGYSHVFGPFLFKWTARRHFKRTRPFLEPLR